LRYFNVYGPRQRPDSPYAAAIPIFIRRMLDGQPPTVFGDGTQARDFVFVGDVVRANLLALEQGQGIYNIGTGQATDTLGLWLAIQEAAGQKMGNAWGPARPGDIRYSALNCARAAAELGWVPQYDLARGLAETWAWRVKQ